MDDWSIISVDQVEKEGGFSVIKLHNGSLIKALMSIYPEHTWKVWTFKKVPKNYWSDKKNQRIFFDWLANKLQVKSVEDWYKVKPSDIINNGGTVLLCDIYHYSIINALVSVYPEMPLHVWKFDKVPKFYWEEPKNRKSYFDWLFRKLGTFHGYT